VSLTLLLSLISYIKKSPVALLANIFFGLSYFVLWYLRFDNPETTSTLALFLHFGFVHLLWILLFTPTFKSLQKWAGYKVLSFLTAAALFIGLGIFQYDLKAYTYLLFISAGLFTGGYFLQGQGLKDFFRNFYSIMAFTTLSLATLSLLFWDVALPLVFLGIAGIGLLWTLGSEIDLLPKKLHPLGALAEGIGWFVILLNFFSEVQSWGFLNNLKPLDLLILLPLASAFFHRLRSRKSEANLPAKINGILSTLTLGILTIIVSADTFVSHHQWYTLGFLGLGFALFFLANHGLLFGQSFAFHLTILGVLISYLAQGEAWSPSFTGVWATFSLGFGTFLLFFPQKVPKETDNSFLGPLWLGLGSLALPFFLFSRELPYLVGPLWMAGYILHSLVKPWITSRKASMTIQSSIHPTWKTLAIIHLTLFWLHHFLVVAQSGNVLAYAPFGGGFSITISHHLVSGAAGLLVMLWSWFHPLWKKSDSSSPMNFLLPFALALGTILLIEFRTDNLALAFALTAVGLNLLGNASEKLSRFRTYSLWFFWISLALLASLTSSLRFPDLGMAAPRILQIVLTLGAQVGMVILFFRGKALAAHPEAKGRSLHFYDLIIRRKNVLVLLPLFFAFGFYLFWALDGTTLTLGWVLEGLLLFVLGLWIKEKLFHYLSLLTVGATLLKLVFADMAGSSDLYKVLVLMVSGIILVIMSVLYGKFNKTKDPPGSAPANGHPKTIPHQGDSDE
jgi:hypothetical protein